MSPKFANCSACFHGILLGSAFLKIRFFTALLNQRLEALFYCARPLTRQIAANASISSKNARSVTSTAKPALLHTLRGGPIARLSIIRQPRKHGFDLDTFPLVDHCQRGKTAGPWVEDIKAVSNFFEFNDPAVKPRDGAAAKFVVSKRAVSVWHSRLAVESPIVSKLGWIIGSHGSKECMMPNF